MLSINPRLLEPDLAFINDTGEIIEINHAVETNRGLCYFGSLQGDHKYMGFDEGTITFLTNKWDWKKTARVNVAGATKSARYSKWSLR